VLRQPAAATGDADEAHLHARVVEAVAARRALAAHHERLDHDGVPDREALDPLAELLDHAGELVPEHDGQRLARQGVRLRLRRRRRERALEEQVQVRAADARPGGPDLHGARLRHGLRHLLDAEVFLAVVPGRLHASHLDRRAARTGRCAAAGTGPTPAGPRRGRATDRTSTVGTTRPRTRRRRSRSTGTVVVVRADADAPGPRYWGA